MVASLVRMTVLGLTCPGQHLLQNALYEDVSGRLTVNKGENKPVLWPSGKGVLDAVKYQQLIVMKVSLMCAK